MRGRDWLGIRLLAGVVFLSPVLVACAEPLPSIDDRWDFQNPAASEAAFRQLVEQGQTAGDPAYQAEALTQLARSVGLQRRFKEAHSILDQAYVLITVNMPRPRVRALLERGRVINSSGSPADSVESFEAALSLAQAEHLEYLAVDAAHMLGIVEQPAAAVIWHEKAIAMAESAEDERARYWLGPLYNNLAWTYSDLGRHDDALMLFEKDVGLRESQGAAFEASIALWSKARMLRALGRVDEALAIQRNLVDHPDRQDNPAEGYTHEEIGECLMMLNLEVEAAAHFAIAHARLGQDPWLRANEAERLERIEQLAVGSSR